MLKKHSNGTTKSNELDSGAHNQIAKGTTIKGDVQTDGVLRIDGTLIGTIESTGKVVVGESGRVEGQILCTSAHISGAVKAKITVKELLSLMATAKVTGEIVTGKISIEPGAVFSGSCSMGGVIKELSREQEPKRAAEKTA